ncbi:MAG: MBL fold metallo-hydrolase [Bacteroidetes bacterium]|jgi:phosphoribosyl 1,2-cyclic phosphodiesterase|nr:MBL fold metallo-hydrolase [Bacteroidota bacterium]MBT6687466.1 MBL fold metallo-hydrolase [Bacteroidota bacterium]MBT7142652.1 MBL fold metallo-hydrolase [Bacteroidota bacterium]MBT7493059.1 MBL fold metallo-hydrolase [Bacteroidota bacterium]
MENINIRTNGRGNAWPIPLGKEHAFYNQNQFEEIANSSFSIISQNGEENESEKINWEVLIDAGHGIIQYLIKENNRIPEALFLTHPHIDHTISTDWIVQSYYRYNKKKFPVYATKLCWEFTLRSFSHLEDMVEFHELKPGIETSVSEIENMKLTAFPVYHGDNVLGSAMLVVEIEDKKNDKHKAIFSGDLLCPILRNIDIDFLSDAKVIYVDSNNRFPSIQTNHWSITSNEPNSKDISKKLSDYKKDLSYTRLISPHLKRKFDSETYSFFESFLKENIIKTNVFMSVFEFLQELRIENTMLIHYSGNEDMKNYNQEVLGEDDLLKWTIEEAKLYRIKSKFFVPNIGHIFKLNN